MKLLNVEIKQYDNNEFLVIISYKNKTISILFEINVTKMNLKDFLLEKVEDNKEKIYDKNKINISNDNLENIYNTQIKRLSYLKYLIEKESKDDNKDKLEKIYNTLKDLSFDDGKMRNIKQLIQYIKEKQRNNNGRIPDIPSNDILKSLDTKMIKFEEYDEDTLEKYIYNETKSLKKVEYSKNDKSESDDVLNSDELTKDQLEDFVEDLKAMEDATPGLCRALCIIDITSGIDVEDVKVPDEKEEKEDSIELDNESSTEDDDIPEDPDEDALMGMGIDPDKLGELFESLNILLEKNEMSVEDEDYLDQRKAITKGKVKKGVKNLAKAGLSGAAAAAAGLIPVVGAPIAMAFGVSSFVKGVRGSLNLAAATSSAISNKKIKNYAENNKMDLEKASIAIASAANGEKDPTKKERLEKQFKMMNYCIYNEKGEKRNVEQQRHFMKKLVGKKGIEQITNASKGNIEKAIESGELDELNRKVDKIKPKDLEKFEKAARRSNDEVQKSIAQYKKEKSNDSEDVKKDEDGNILKQEEVKDPKTGEKKKGTTHTGPRGGKFYYPDGKPKTPENKVYVQESLKNYLINKLN